MKEKQLRMREQQAKKDAEQNARQILLKVNKRRLFLVFNLLYYHF